MNETTNTAETPDNSHEASDSQVPIIHRICEACNNMFAVRADEPTRRCAKCHK